MILLDTNVLSELMRPEPSDDVVEWISSQPPSSLYTTSITQAEILHGIRLLAAGKRRAAFESAARSMFEEEFRGRIFPFGSDSASAYAEVASSRRRTGRPVSHFDAQIAAIALSHGASIATRNVADFDACGVEVINPWSA